VSVSISDRLLAFLTYPLIVVGWLLVLIFGRGSRLARFHVKQSVGLWLFAIGVTVGWAAIGWVLAWIPYVAAVSAALFSLAAAAWFFAAILWLIGMVNALRGRPAPLPIIGGWANGLWRG
jgi:uncharacterized membrane protein